MIVRDTYIPEPEHQRVKARRRENMVGVSMVLASFVASNRGLRKSSGIECFGGILLEPCLLQQVRGGAPGGDLRRTARMMIIIIVMFIVIINIIIDTKYC